MRRLTEILAFPRAWYRRSIVRRLFLGDLSMTAESTSSHLETWGTNAEGDMTDNARYPNESRSERSPLLREKVKVDETKHSKIKGN